jgi:hypothetical protein
MGAKFKVDCLEFKLKPIEKTILTKNSVHIAYTIQKAWNVAHPQTSTSSRDIHNKKINRLDVLFNHMITQWVQKNLNPLPGQIFIGRKGLRPPELKRHR